MTKKNIFLATAIITSVFFLCGCGNITLMARDFFTASSTAYSLSSNASIDYSLSSVPSATAPSQTADSLSENSRSQTYSFPDDTSDEIILYESLSYFIPALSESERTNFLALYQGIMSFDEIIRIPSAAGSEEIKDLMTLLCNECPELLQLDSSWEQTSTLLGTVTEVRPSYLIDEETYLAQRSAIEELLSQFHNQLTGYSDYQIELFLYNTIISNCIYDQEAAFCQSAYGTFIDGYAKCDGRAKALVWGLRSFGIKSSVITGSNHAWVLVNIDGFDYNADPTYDDNEVDGIQRPCTYAHFNIPESAIYSNPYPADELYQRRGYPQTVRWDANYHVQNGLWVFANQSGQDLFMAQLSAAAEAGGGIVTLRFESNEDFEAANASVSQWIQDYLNQSYRGGCNITTYDCSQMQMIFLEVSF